MSWTEVLFGIIIVGLAASVYPFLLEAFVICSVTCVGICVRLMDILRHTLGIFSWLDERKWWIELIAFVVLFSVCIWALFLYSGTYKIPVLHPFVSVLCAFGLIYSIYQIYIQLTAISVSDFEEESDPL